MALLTMLTMRARRRTLWAVQRHGAPCLAASVAALVFAFVAAPVGATHLGTIAEVFPIAEDDALVHLERQLHQRAASGQLARDQAALRARIEQRTLRPVPVAAVRRTTTTTVRYYDPTVWVQADIRDHEGKLVLARGTRANPFDQVVLSKRVLFFDGADPDQVAWAARERAQGAALLVLVGGAPIELERRWRTPVYFDQGGAMVRQLGIEQVPARISQDGKRLRIEEVRP